MDIGFSEILFIMLLALILFGPRKLPEIARQMGKFMAEFRRASTDFQSQIHEEIRKIEPEEDPTKALAPAGEVLNKAESSISTTLSRLTDRLKNFPQDHDYDA